MISLSVRARETILATLILALVFAAGALSATAWLRLTTPDRPFGPERGRPAQFQGPPRVPASLAPDLARRLDLDEEQRAAVMRVLEEHHARSRTLLEGIQPQLTSQLDSARSQIRALLDPAQQQIFDEYLESHRSFMAERFGMRGRAGRGRR